MTDKKTRLYTDLIQIPVWICVLAALSVGFFFMSGGTLSIWTALKAGVQSLFYPCAIYVVNYYYLIPNHFFAGRKRRFYLVNIVIILMILFVPVLFSSDIKSFEKTGIEDLVNGFSITRFLIGAVVIRILLYVCVIALAIGMKYMRRWYEEKKKIEEDRRRNVEAELHWLKNQLNPHFLFNTLNNISSLVRIDADKAQESIAQLSELLRYALYESNVAKVKVVDEVEFMRNYISLMSLRCSDKTKVNVRFDQFDESIQISPLLFISLVENAFKHGTSTHTDSFVNVDMGMDGSYVVFSSENSIISRTTADYSGSGVGLENMRRRLELLYPDRHSYQCFTEGDTYVAIVRINLQITDSNDGKQ